MAEMSPNGSQGGRRILVVDDDATIRLLCRRLLEGAGYRVLEAEGSSEAMALLATGQEVDLILADLFLPPPDFQLASSKSQYQRVNGHEMVPQLLAMKKTLRVLYMSSHPRENLIAQQIVLGPAPFLQKPLSKDALLSQVEAALQAPPLQYHDTSAGTKKDVRWVD